MIVLMLAFLPAGAQSQEGKSGQQPDWHQYWKAQKIAFLTDAIGLTPEEAERFWPVYNQAEAEKGQAFNEMFKAYKALEDAVNAGKKDKEVAKLVDRYLESLTGDKAVDIKYTQIYRTFLSETKVARLFLAEEKFRREQIHRLKKADTKKTSHTDY